ncbi:2-keto-4-pentenoate hydratase [Salinibacterium sp. ZJ450]|uniref:2-keto-4-pentenoate hydratase n=1 Tax=Salinibacterium sp. ZJ450 TaxID=2708338 RepID=UPI00142104E3|nr:fumarylacetoacetate hydrolase family protein [Salinibacterium sp. ZJ450]
MTTTTRNALIARELLEADRTGQPVPRLTHRFDGLSVDDAYAIQSMQLEEHQAAGRVLVGRKVGLTSLAMQKQLGVDSPDFGYFFDDMVYGDGAAIPVARFIAPKVEPEYAFVLAHDLTGPGVSLEDAAAAVASVHPAIEIIDSRIANWDIGLVDTIADNASCGAIVVGRETLDIPTEELGKVECVLRFDGVAVDSGLGSAVMGNPLAPLAWLANVLGERGVTLKAGQTVLPGAFMAAAPVEPGLHVTADFGVHGALSVSFV